MSNNYWAMGDDPYVYNKQLSCDLCITDPDGRLQVLEHKGNSVAMDNHIPPSRCGLVTHLI